MSIAQRWMPLSSLSVHCKKRQNVFKVRAREYTTWYANTHVHGCNLLFPSVLPCSTHSLPPFPGWHLTYVSALGCRQYENRKDVYITNFWGSVDWARVSTRYAEASGDVVPEALPSPERQVLAGIYVARKRSILRRDDDTTYVCPGFVGVYAHS